MHDIRFTQNLFNYSFLALRSFAHTFVMVIRISYHNDLIGRISALAGFSYMKIVPQHAMPVG